MVDRSTTSTSSESKFKISFQSQIFQWILNLLLPTLSPQHMTGEFSREEKEAHFAILKIHNELKGQVKINLLFTKVSGPCLFYSPE